MPEVKCSVSNCVYWDDGNVCTAPAIMVEIDQHARRQFDAEIAAEVGYDSKHRDYAASSAETCCHTFKPRK